MKYATIIICMLTLALAISCSSNNTKPSARPSASSSVKKSTSSSARAGATYTGKASYYADKFHGRTTASGAKYDKKKLTAAHKTLPFGTVVEVTNMANNKKVTVTINDRGPFVAGRIIDLSRAAAEKIDMVTAGVVDVKVRIVSMP